MEQRYNKAWLLKWERKSTYRNTNLVNLSVSYEIMKGNKNGKDKDFFMRITNAELCGKKEMRVRIIRNKNLSTQEKTYPHRRKHIFLR